MNQKLLMTLEKETPGTYRYKSEDEDSPIQTLYIKKAAFPKGKPAQRIQVEVKSLEVKAVA